MPALPRTPFVLAALTTIGAAAVLYRLHCLRRALNAERAARRLTAGQQHRDLEAFARRIRAAVDAHHTLTEAQEVLDSALSAHHPEGGHP